MTTYSNRQVEHAAWLQRQHGTNRVKILSAAHPSNTHYGSYLPSVGPVLSENDKAVIQADFDRAEDARIARWKALGGAKTR